LRHNNKNNNIINENLKNLNLVKSVSSNASNINQIVQISDNEKDIKEDRQHVSKTSSETKSCKVLIKDIENFDMETFKKDSSMTSSKMTLTYNKTNNNNNNNSLSFQTHHKDHFEK